MARLTPAVALLVSPAIGLAAVEPPDEAEVEPVEAQSMNYGQDVGQNGKAFASSVRSCLARERPDLAV